MNDANSNQKKITVVITAYNAERYISRCIDSIINQKEEECEIIVVNDASTDKTEEVTKKYGDRIKYIEFEENRGPAAGRTSGLFETDTEFVAFLDADDYWKEDFASVMKEFLVSEESMVAANCGYIKKDYNGKHYFRPNLNEQDKEYYRDGNVCDNFYEFWANYKSLLTGTVLMRTQIAQETGGQRKDLRLTEDFEFWGYLATFGEWGFVPEHLFVTDEQVLNPRERLKKFKKRFAFFKELDIQTWTKRIKPALSDSRSIEALDNFLKTIYTTIAFSKAYSFSFRDSYRFSKKNKEYLNNDGWGKAIRYGLKGGPVFWPIICIGLRGREIIKAYLHPIKKIIK
jgi:glycosyltransferase involved in cell wall biosynthesis